MLDDRTNTSPMNPYVISCRWSLSITHEETLENLRFSDIFRVYRKRPLAWNGLIKIRNRSSHQRCSAKKVLLKISQVSQESSVLEFLFNKVAGLQACNFIKKKLQHRCFPVRFVKFLRRPILRKHLWRTASQARDITGWIKTLLVKTMINCTQKNILQDHLNNQLIYLHYTFEVLNITET